MRGGSQLNSWSKLSGGSEKQFHDALRVFEAQGAILERPYLDQWAKRLGVEDDWPKIISVASDS